jgi:hypothetical protein
LNKVKNCGDVWYEVVVPDPSSLSGNFVGSFLLFVSDYLGANKIVLDDLTGAGVRKLLESYTHTVVEIREIIELINEAVQFDWCNFLLFDNCGFIPEENQEYPEFIAKTVLTVRAIDDTELHVYTRSNRLVAEIKAKYEKVEVTEGELESFHYAE